MLDPRTVALVVVDACSMRAARATTAWDARSRPAGREALGACRFDRDRADGDPAIQRLLAFFRARGLRLVYLTVGSELPDY